MRDIVTLALDRSASVRSVDADGHLRIATAVLTRAIVSQYAGSEIPGADKLGLQPATIYNVLRDPKALAEGAASFCGKPLLSQHIPLSAADHPTDVVVGAVGNDVTFDGQDLRGSLIVWDQRAIDDITSGAARDLSAGYRYAAVPENGSFEGVPYTLKMTGVQFNHLALVPHGRTPGAVVSDAALPEPPPKGRKTMSETVDPDVDTNNDPDPTDAVSKVLGFLKSKLSAVDLKAVEGLLNPDKESDMPEAAIAKQAMDADRLMNRWNAIRTAEREVRPCIGEIESTPDSAAAVYKMALDANGVDLRDIPVAAYRGMLRMLPGALAAQRVSTRQVLRSAAQKAADKEMFPHGDRLQRGR